MNPMFSREIPPRAVQQLPVHQRPHVVDLLKACGHAESEIGHVPKVVNSLHALAEELWPHGGATAFDSELTVCSSSTQDSPHSASAPGTSILTSTRPVRLLGFGAFARVWLAKLRNGSPCVVKQLCLHDLYKVRQCHMAGREVRLMRQLATPQPGMPPSPLVIRCFGTASSLDGQYLYQCLEPLLGGTLLDVVGRAGPAGLPKRHARFYLACLLLALQKLHHHGIVHRDLKPDNVVLRASLSRLGLGLSDGLSSQAGAYDGYPVLIDLGFARTVDTNQAAPASCDAKLECGDGHAHGSGDHGAAQAAADGIVAAGLVCCSCPCVGAFRAAGEAHAQGRTAPELPHHLHPYHSPSESAVHWARCVAAYRAGYAGTPVPQASPDTPAAALPSARDRASSVLGPVHAMPPEMSSHAPGGHDTSADVWCLGVMAAEVLTGVSPLTGKRVRENSDGQEDDEGVNSIELGQRAAKGQLTIPPELASVWPAADAFLRACMQVEPRARPTVPSLMAHDFFTGACPVQEGTCSHGPGALCWLCWQGQWAELAQGTVLAPFRPCDDQAKMFSLLGPDPQAPKHFGEATFTDEEGTAREEASTETAIKAAPAARIHAAPNWDGLELTIEYGL